MKRNFDWQENKPGDKKTLFEALGSFAGRALETVVETGVEIKTTAVEIGTAIGTAIDTALADDPTDHYPAVSNPTASDPGTVKKNTFKPSDIRKCMEKIDGLYSLTDETPYGQWLRECAQLKAELPALRTAGEAAQRILGIYYQPGRIRDTLNKLDVFTQRISADSDPEKTRIKGYNNYCFLLMYDVEALGQVSIPEPEPVRAGPEAVEALLTEECSQMELWKELPEVRRFCQEILERLSSREPSRFYGDDRRKIARINRTREALDVLTQLPTWEMEERLESMRDQNQALRENIRQAREIRQRLLPVLTEEWFQRLDPETEDNPINQMTPEQIQQLYRESLEGLIVP